MSSNAHPFPLGLNMNPSSTESQKKFQAKIDLYPDAIGRPLRQSYWSSSLTSRHELFHVNDWTNSFYKPKVHEAEDWIETQYVSVTTSCLNPTIVLSSKISDFDDKLLEKTNEANANYNLGKENRAYGDGKAAYQSLSDSIIP